MNQFGSIPLQTRPSTHSLSTVSAFGSYSLLLVYVLTLASLLICFGGQWDIMWHKSIGRDVLLSPPHVAIYIGATIAGISSAYQILQLTFQRNHPSQHRAIHFWGFFRGTTSSLFGAWGGIAMLTSAPFDDWWHGTYGLDITLLSPPHMLLLTGMMMVIFSAVISALSLLNQSRDKKNADAGQLRTLRFLFALTSALLLTVVYSLFNEKLADWLSHRSQFYIVGGVLFPGFLCAIGLASQQRYPMTTVAGLCMLLLLIPSWGIQFFPAVPKLAPVLNPIEHFQPLRFPLALVVPALGMDMVLHRFRTIQNRWLLAGLLGLVFWAIFLLVQWRLSEFLLTSPLSRNRLLLAYSWAYSLSPDYPYRYAFHPDHVEKGWRLIQGLGIALLVSIASARVGLLVSSWMQKIVR